MRTKLILGYLMLITAVPLFADVNRETPPAENREKVLGIGGFFFRAKDPDALAKWYLDNLGINLIPDSYDKQPWAQEAGPTAFAPFPADTDYFGDPKKDWMLNFRVKNLDAMAAQLRAAGITVKVGSKTYPNGRFAHLKDPEGNPIELWEPAVAAKAGQPPQNKAP
jgi:glyoxylase I family protein